MHQTELKEIKDKISDIDALKQTAQRLQIELKIKDELLGQLTNGKANESPS
ncbi:MAG: hypothetical protein P8X74_05400 [Reinekea sp.]